MAKFDNFFESGQGKLGNLVFYRVGGSGRVRTRAGHFSDRKSPAQLAQRQRLQVTTGFLKPFSELLRITFASAALGRSAMQAAQSYNMRNALAGEYPDISIDKGNVLLSWGSLPLPVRATVIPQPEGLLIEWENGDEAAGERANDTLVMIALPAGSGSVDYRFTGIRRSESQFLYKPAFPQENNLIPDIWMAFRDRQETQLSKSLYLERQIL